MSIAKEELILQERLTKKYHEMNMNTYEEGYKDFDYEKVVEEFEGLGEGKYNICHEAIDRHVKTPRKNKVALYWQDAQGEKQEMTFEGLSKMTNKVGNALKALGVTKGDRVFTFMPRLPELYIAALAIPKIGAILGPLFAAFGPEAVKDRLASCDAKVLITTSEQYKRMEEAIPHLPALKHIVIVGLSPDEKGDLLVSYEEIVNNASEELEIEPMELEDPFIIHYTSGSTGAPKGVVHRHKAMLGHYQTSKWVLDLREDDIYWCTADPGWVTGTSYGIFGPWLNGVTQVINSDAFSADSWYKIIQDFGVTVWYTAPTALRMLMKAGDKVVEKYNLTGLRHICSAGEPLNPEVIRWGLQVYGLPIHDTWWQTETGSMMIVNFPCLDIKPGSMGKPVPGIQAAVIDPKGNALPPGSTGILAIKTGWPSMMGKIWGDEEKYQEYFKIKGWYTSGDTAYMDKEGYFWFIGRADDLINTSGHRVGPFEVENALVEHPAVAEAGVIGKPDKDRGEIIKAFITLREGVQVSPKVLKDIQMFVKKHLAAHAYPREIEIVNSLPKTRSGKIMRRVLKSKELNLPIGDISSLEDD